MRISVIIPSYNYGRFIREAVDSVLAQTVAAHEIIVVDDGSKDDTLQVLSAYGARIRVVEQANAGVSAARNRGVSESSGELVAFLDADDTWAPTKLDKQLARLQRDPKLGLVHTGMHVTDVAGRILSTNIVGKEGWIADKVLTFQTGVNAPGSSSLIPRAVFDEIGGYKSDSPPSEDWDLSYRICRRYPIGFVAEPLLHYRQHGAGAHLRMDKFARGQGAALRRAFEDLSPNIQRLRARSYGAFHRMVAGGYLANRQYREAADHMLDALRNDPARSLVYACQFPVRRARALLARLRPA